ncbi:MAG: beta-lactamase family protein [Thermoproteota archaeon]|nr:beta-lactamase family protein [Thermoproteota archaeon]
MNSTSVDLSDEQKSRLATGHLLGRELALFNISNPMVSGGGLYSSASDMLKFVSANIGLIKTKLDNAMQESHLIRHSTGQTIPNNLRVSGNNTNPEFYIGLGGRLLATLCYRINVSPANVTPTNKFKIGNTECRIFVPVIIPWLPI